MRTELSRPTRRDRLLDRCGGDGGGAGVRLHSAVPRGDFADADVRHKETLGEAMNETRTADDSRPPADTHDDLMDVARLAYIYGFPAYEMARLRVQAFSQGVRGARLRMNTLYHARALTTPRTGRVTNTNADVLKSSARLDLSQGPLVIKIPGAADRYYSLALMDAFTNNFAVLGQRTPGAGESDFFLVGPQWDAVAPAGMTLLRAPTNAAWALVRIMIDGPDDLPAVHALQDRFSIASPPRHLSENATGVAVPLSKPALTFDSDKPLTFFEALCAVLTANPPPARDKPVLDRLRAIRVGPSLQFSRRDFTPPQLDALREGIAAARDAIQGRGGVRARDLSRVGPNP